MQSDRSFSLSRYQKAVLNQMGISLWSRYAGPTEDAPEQQTPAKEHSVNRAAENIARLKQLTQSAPVANKPADKPSLSESAEPFVQRPEAVESEVRSMAGKVLLLLPETVAQSDFIQDVINALELKDSAQYWQSEGTLAEFCDYRFAICPGSELKLTANSLTLPELTTLKRADMKRSLWQKICALHG